jgi:hypothetical protein
VKKRLWQVHFHHALGLLSLSFLASILLRIPHYQHSLTFVDEGFFASVAAELLHGKSLYRDVWCNNQPLAIYFCKWIFQILGVSSIALHLGSLLLALLESWLLYRIGCSCVSPRVGGLAALVYALASTNFYAPRIIGYTPEQLMVVFTTAAVHFFLRGLASGRASFHFWVGLLSFAAVMSKPAAAPEALMFAVFLMCFAGLSVPQKTRALAWLGCGFLAGIAALIANLVAAGTLDLWWSQSIVSRASYVEQVGWPLFLRQLARLPLVFGLIYLWAWILIWIGRQAPQGDRIARRLSLVWLAAAFLGVLMGRRFYANYFIQVFPAMSILAALGLDLALQKEWRTRLKIVTRVCLVAFLLPFLWFQARTFAHLYFFMDREAHRQVRLWDMCVIDRNLQEVSAAIRVLTRPEDPIFVWGPNPEFYFLSERRMATVYPFFDITDAAQPPYGAEEQETLDTLIQSPPALILDTFRDVKMEQKAGWNDLLVRHYRPFREMGGVRIYLRRDVSQPGRRFPSGE